MRLLHVDHVFEVINLHVERLLVLHHTLHLLHQRVARLLVLLNPRQHLFDGLVFVEVLGAVELGLERDCFLLQLGDLVKDLLLHVFFALIGLFAGLAELMTELVLQLVGRRDLTLAALLFLSNDLSADA